MKVQLERVSRRLRWPRWATAVAAVWFSLVALTFYLSSLAQRPVVTCLFRRITGLPCPTCGATRGAVLILHGRVAEAWLLNPLLFTVGGLALAGLSLRLAARRRVVLRGISPMQRKSLLGGFVLVFLLNWLYILLQVR